MYRFFDAVAVLVVGEVRVENLADVQAFLGARCVVRKPHRRRRHVAVRNHLSLFTVIRGAHGQIGFKKEESEITFLFFVFVCLFTIHCFWFRGAVSFTLAAWSFKPSIQP